MNKLSLPHGVTCLMGVAFLAASGCHSADAPSHAQATGFTQSVAVNQVEDAAIWIHPADNAKSLLLIANKTHGMEIHNVAGTLIKHYEDGRALAGVDVLYHYSLGGQDVDLAIAASPGAKDSGVRVWKIDPVKLRLTEITHGAAIRVLEDADPLGIVACHAGGRPSFFVTSEEGKIEQYTLVPAADETISAEKVRTITLPGKVKAGVADERTGLIYFAAEKKGIFAIDANPTASREPRLIIPVNENMTPDLTGITLYAASENAGYLIVVCQKPKGDRSTLFLFDRAAPHAFVRQIMIDDGAVGGVYSSSGIAVTNMPLSSKFPAGMLALKNRINPNATEDYKLFSWAAVARDAHLLIDTMSSPRGPAALKP